ncbi:MAG TPA: LuxR C-terminal-related transcriptional regulator, partial [Pseudonocardiaceae bacterium]|nr:LuxR C-terminal-related transcriptional regulator [Pseudonocardiaceae bacterium]
RELVESGIDHGVLSEVAGVWRWEGPWITTPRLVELISERIGRLEPAEQEVLEIVAYGEPIGADLLTSLAERHTVETLESRNLLRARQEGRRVDVRLAHPLYGQVLRARCPAERAAAVRRTLADAVEATGARREDDDLRIATWRLNACAPLAPELVVAAARQAFAALDLPLAERLARAAGERHGDPAADAVLWRVLFLSHRYDEAEAVLTRLAAAPPNGQDGCTQAVGRACTLFWGQHRGDEAIAVLQEARDTINDSDRRGELDLLECLFHLWAARVGQARRGLVDLRARPRLGPRTAARLPVAHGMVLVHQGRLARARDVLELSTGPDLGWTDEIPRIAESRWMYRCHAALFAGLFAEAAELAASFYTHAAQPEWDLALRLACTLQAQVARLRGRVRTAARWAREGHRRYVHQPRAPFRCYVLGELAHAEALAGHAASAVAVLTEAGDGPVPSETHVQPWVELARSWVAVAAGEGAAAVRLATAAAEYARAWGMSGAEAFGLHDVVRLGAAELVLHRLEELARDVEGDLVRAFADHAVAAVQADPDGLEAVGKAFAGLGADLMAAEAYAQAAHAYQRRGLAASDRRLCAQAALLLDGCEGARTPLVADVAAPQLTTREREIARLAAEGWSNQEIAERMVISIRTVGNHLYHVYAKLGISGRSALAALLPPLGPSD